MNWHWPDKDDAAVVCEMKENPNSPEWARCYDFLHALIRRIFSGGGCPDDIKEDAVQVTITKVFQSLGTFSCNASLKNWLWTILKNTVYDLLDRGIGGKRIVSLEAFQEAHEEGFEIAIETWTPEDGYVTSEEIYEAKAGYRAHLKRTSPKTADRDFDIWERHLEGHSVKEIAEDLQLKAATVRYALRKAKRYFKWLRSQLHRKD